MREIYKRHKEILAKLNNINMAKLLQPIFTERKHHAILVLLEELEVLEKIIESKNKIQKVYIFKTENEAKKFTNWFKKMLDL